MKHEQIKQTPDDKAQSLNRKAVNRKTVNRKAVALKTVPGAPGLK